MPEVGPVAEVLICRAVRVALATLVRVVVEIRAVRVALATPVTTLQLYLKT
jgi:hypothetical protein